MEDNGLIKKYYQKIEILDLCPQRVKREISLTRYKVKIHNVCMRLFFYGFEKVK